MRTRTIGAALAVACTLALAACSSNDDKPAKATTPTINTAVTQPPIGTVEPSPVKPAAPTTQVGGTLTLVNGDGGPLDVTLVKIVETKAANNFTAPKAGNRLIAIQWKITNKATAPINQNPAGARIIDADGQQWSQHFGETVDATPEYPSAATIGPGESRVGWLTYELPAAAKVAEVQLQTGGALTAVTGTWRA